MLSHWTIKLFHAIFVSSLGAVTLWLLFVSMTSDMVRRSSPKQRAELLLRVWKDGTSYLSLPLGKGHYLIGRGPECDIFLKGPGIPLKVAEIYMKGDDYHLRMPLEDEGEGNEKMLLPGEKLMLYNYAMQLDKREIT